MKQNNETCAANKIVTFALGTYMFFLPWDAYIVTETVIPLSPSFIFLGIFLVIYVFHAFKNNLYQIVMPKYMIPIILLLIYATTTLIWTQEQYDSILLLIQLWSFFVIAMLILGITHQMRISQKSILWFYIIGTLSVGIVALIINDEPMSRFTIAKEYNPTWYAAFIVWAIVSSFKLVQVSNLMNKVILIMINMMFIVFLLLTQGRNAILAISVSWLMVSLLHFIFIKIEKGFYFIGINLKIIKSFVAVILIAVTIIIFMFTSGLSEHLNRVEDIGQLVGGDSSRATAGRTVIWQNYLRGMDKHTIFGAGIWSSQFVYKIIYGVEAEVQPPHNTYLLTLIEYGILGLLFWLLFLWYLIQYALKNTDSRFLLLWISFITTLMAIGNDILNYKYWWTGLFIFILLNRTDNTSTSFLKRNTDNNI